MEKIIYFSRSNRPKTCFAPSSSGFAPVYEERISSNGRKNLFKIGEHNINDFVQSSLDSTLVYNILEKFQQGDVSVLEKVQGFYSDVTSVPKTLLETHNFMKSISSKFDQLPVEYKEKFGNSADVFIKSLENGEFNKIMCDIAQNKGLSSSDPIVDIAQKKVGEK